MIRNITDKIKQKAKRDYKITINTIKVKEERRLYRNHG